MFSNTLHHYELSTSDWVAQGYDGTAVMSGHVSGVQKGLKEVALNAEYVHYYAHCLNLVLVDTTKKFATLLHFVHQ